jgi:transketolase
VFVGGSAIIGQKDVRATILEFRKKITRARRNLLIRKAHSLGGVELVNKWIDLHEVGKKKNELLQISKEAGFA